MTLQKKPLSIRLFFAPLEKKETKENEKNCSLHKNEQHTHERDTSTGKRVHQSSKKKIQRMNR